MSVVRSNSSQTDLDTRVENRKRELIAEIVDHKKNPSRTGAAEAVDRLKAQLSELAQIVKEGGPNAKVRLDEWMAK